MKNLDRFRIKATTKFEDEIDIKEIKFINWCKGSYKEREIIFGDKTIVKPDGYYIYRVIIHYKRKDGSSWTSKPGYIALETAYTTKYEAKQIKAEAEEEIRYFLNYDFNRFNKLNKYLMNGFLGICKEKNKKYD